MTEKNFSVTISVVMGNKEMLERANLWGVELERKPADRIVITGAVARTSLGNAEETIQGFLEGRSGVVEFPVNNAFVNIAAPLQFNPQEHFDRRELRGKARIHALAVYLARELAIQSKLRNGNGELDPRLDRRQMASWIGSGIGSSLKAIDIHQQLSKAGEKTGTIDPVANSRFINPFKGLEIFPEEINSSVAAELGLKGPGGSTVAACAGGTDNMVEALEKIKNGYAKLIIAGAIEDPFADYPAEAIGVFAGMRSVLSTRNDDPQKASRPFDRDRDGFVLGAGAAFFVFEELEHALRREAPILAEVDGFAKAMDGGEPTNVDIQNAAETMIKTLYNEKTKEFLDVDVIVAHATSTMGESKGSDDIRGDLREAEAFRRVFGEDLRNIAITANKGNIGHTAAASGPISLLEAINIVRTGNIPHILNLENPDPQVEDLNLVRNKPSKRPSRRALINSNGFGGYGAAIAVSRYEE